MTTDDAQALARKEWDKLWSEAEKEGLTPVLRDLGCWALDHEEGIRSALSGSGETDKLRGVVEGLMKTMESIACFNDTGASERLEKTGSYGAFDEPGSVEIAREAIAEAKEKLK